MINRVEITSSFTLTVQYRECRSYGFINEQTRSSSAADVARDAKEGEKGRANIRGRGDRNKRKCFVTGIKTNPQSSDSG